jgi:tetratricopeptide (TPR) repeat protein
MVFPTHLNLGLWRTVIAWPVALVLANVGLLSAQSNPIPMGDSSRPSQGLPFINAGPDSRFAQLDFAEMYLDNLNKHAKVVEEERRKNAILVETGVVSALDILAPNNAVQEFNRATTLLKAQDSKEASKHLQKAIHHYPKFVSAHNALGLAYLDQNDPRAKSEFETAAQLDDKFPVSFLNLGLLALEQKDFVTAQSNLEKAARLNPRDAKGLSALAFAQRQR